MLSVIIIAQNEEANLRACLQSICWADEIIVIDSGSTDQTVAIAKEFTDKVYTAAWQGYGIQKQRALSYATQNWVLNLDADEVVSQELRQEITEKIHVDEADAYQCPIRLNFYGRSLYYSWSPKHHIRLFKRVGAHYTDHIVHEAIVLPKSARIGYLKQGIQHYCLRDISHALEKMNAYSSYTAIMRRKNQPVPSLAKIVLGSTWMFLRAYFIQGGCLEGRDGFLLAVLSAQSSFYRGIKMLYHDKEN